MRRQAQPNQARVIAKTILRAAALAALFAGSAHAQLESTGALPSTTTGRNASRKILISIPDRKLALIENGEVRKLYEIAVGKRGTPTPAGEFTIINRITNPTWYGHESGSPVAPGPENPLGTRWMGLSKKGYGIHGTNVPKSIGTRASGGCIRMAQSDLEELFDLLRIGDVVVLEAQRTAEVATVFGPLQAPAVKPAAMPASLVVAAAAM